MFKDYFLEIRTIFSWLESYKKKETKNSNWHGKVALITTLLFKTVIEFQLNRLSDIINFTSGGTC